MTANERRIDQRINIRVPLRFRVLNVQGAVEQTAESENISQRGLYFATNDPLKVGTPVQVTLRMPQELVGKAATEVTCVARVVHVQRGNGLGSKTGVGVRIERYEARAAASDSWAT